MQGIIGDCEAVRWRGELWSGALKDSTGWEDDVAHVGEAGALELDARVHRLKCHVNLVSLRPGVSRLALPACEFGVEA